MKVRVTLPYEFHLDTQIVSLEMNINENELTYRRILEILAGSFIDHISRLIICDREIMVIVIVDNKRMNPNDQVRDGDRITLMMPLEGG